MRDQQVEVGPDLDDDNFQRLLLAGLVVAVSVSVSAVVIDVRRPTAISKRKECSRVLALARARVCNHNLNDGTRFGLLRAEARRTICCQLLPLLLPPPVTSRSKYNCNWFRLSGIIYNGATAAAATTTTTQCLSGLLFSHMFIT